MVKIYVGKLSDKVTDIDLRNLFEQFGTVEDAERVRDRDIGFVHMPNEQMAMTAVRKLNRYNLHGSCLKVELSQRVKVQKFFIGNVAFEATEEEIAEFFESYGVKVINAENTNKGFGFVRIENAKGFYEINNLMKRVNGASFKGRTLKLELSEDLSKEAKEAARQTKEEEQFRQWRDATPAMRPAPGFQPQPGPGPSGRGRGLSAPSDDYWPSRPHSNKMREGGMFGASKPQPYPYQMLSVDTEFGGGYEQPKSSKDPAEEVNTLLNNYTNILSEATAASQTELFETGKFSDYILQCEGIEFKVHRAIVAPKSHVMMNVMSLQNSPMLIRDVDSGTLEILLRFLYSGKVDIFNINPAKIMKLLTAAELYQVELVKEGLEATLMENIQLDTAVDFLIFSEELQLSNLRMVVSKFICKNSREMKARPDFGKLKQYPHLVMELFEHASA